MIHIQWYWLVLIWMAGGIIGFFIAALCAVAHDADRHIEHIYHEPGSEATMKIKEAVGGEKLTGFTLVGDEAQKFLDANGD